MPLTNIQIFTQMGISPAVDRNAIIADFLSEGLEGLQNMTEEEVRDACSSYAKRQDGVFPVILTPVQRQRMWALVLWVKDRVRVQQPVQFEDATTQNDLRGRLSRALTRERRRKDQKKEEESYLDSTFNNKLKSTAQWEKWNEELESNLCHIIGCRGVPLSYVIRDDATPDFDETLPFEEATYQAMSLTGVEYAQDARTVHKIILKNVHEDSDAYTYIKPLLRHRNGRRDILALRERYASNATRQTTINKEKARLSTLRYKNERSFTFERFSSELQKAYDELEVAGRPVINGDIVDALWDRIQSPDLQMYISSLKVEYQRNPRDYRLILQDISAEAGRTKTVTFAPGTRGISATYTKKGKCPSSGVHTTDGSIYIGSYDKDKWQSESVKQYHQEIRDTRSKEGSKSSNNDGGTGFPSRNQKRQVNAIKRNKRKLKNLEAKIAAAKQQLKEDDDDGSSHSDDAGNAGDAFGGKRKKKS